MKKMRKGAHTQDRRVEGAPLEGLEVWREEKEKGSIPHDYAQGRSRPAGCYQSDQVLVSKVSALSNFIPPQGRP